MSVGSIVGLAPFGVFTGDGVVVMHDLDWIGLDWSDRCSNQIKSKQSMHGMHVKTHSKTSFLWK